MTGTAINPILFGLSLLAAVVGTVAPLGALGVMFWHWHKELYPAGGGRKKIRHPYSCLVEYH